MQNYKNIPTFLEVLYNFRDQIDWYSKTQSISSKHFHNIYTNNFSINIDKGPPRISLHHNKLKNQYQVCDQEMAKTFLYIYK